MHNQKIERVSIYCVNVEVNARWKLIHVTLFCFK